MIINHNLGAMNAQRQMSTNQNNMGNSMEKLSSGLRINRAGDDAAGLAISEKMRGQIRGLEQADRNAQDGISMIQTAEGALNETHSILQRMRELAVQASNDTNVDADRNEIQKEMNQLTSEINRIGNSTEFNTKNLLDGGGQAVGGLGNVSQTTQSVAGEAGQYSFNLTGIEASDAVTINSETFTAGPGAGQFAVGADEDATAQNLADTINGDDNSAYTATADGTTITLTEKVASNTALTSANLTVTDNTSGGSSTATLNGITEVQGGTAAAAGQYDVDLTTNVAAGEIVKFGSVLLTEGEDFDAGNTAADTASAIATALTEEGTYTASANNSTLTLTETNASGTDLTDSNVEVTTDFSANFQIGANEGQSMTISIADMRAEGLGISGASEAVANGMGDKAAGAVFTEAVAVNNGTDNTGTESALDVSTHENASKAVEAINQAIEGVSAQRSELGAYQNRLEHTINNLGTSAENLQAAESRIRDVDMAKEMMDMTKNNILSQASQSMLAQANQQPQSVLQLLQ